MFDSPKDQLGVRFPHGTVNPKRSIICGNANNGMLFL